MSKWRPKDKAGTAECWAVLNGGGYLLLHTIQWTKRDATNAAGDGVCRTWEVAQRQFNFRVVKVRVSVTEEVEAE